MIWCSNFIMHAGKHVFADTCTYKATSSLPHKHMHALGADIPEAACLEVWFIVLRSLNNKHCRTEVIHFFFHLQFFWRYMQSLKRMFVTALWNVLVIVSRYYTEINVWHLVFDGQWEILFYVGLFWRICTCKISSLCFCCFAINHW